MNALVLDSSSFWLIIPHFNNLCLSTILMIFMYLFALFYLKAIITAYLPNPLQLSCIHSFFHILMLSVDEMQLWLRPVIQTMACLLSQPCRNIQSCILYSVHERCCLSLYAVICCWWLKNRNWILLPNWFWQPWKLLWLNCGLTLPA